MDLTPTVLLSELKAPQSSISVSMDAQCNTQFRQLQGRQRDCCNVTLPFVP